jgi:hypothetical protein
MLVSPLVCVGFPSVCAGGAHGSVGEQTNRLQGPSLGERPGVAVSAQRVGLRRWSLRTRHGRPALAALAGEGRDGCRGTHPAEALHRLACRSGIAEGAYSAAS